MKSEKSNQMVGELLEDEAEISLEQLCRACELTREDVVNMVDEGILDPLGPRPAAWRFQVVSLRRVRVTRTLQQELGVNTPGAALALDLLEELEELRARLRRLEG
ncbi:MAG: chaperone modulator CbpM [Gammaproteobacteria bacterium]|jgi:chaperone modulatory protein CbpM|nr:chaperone modulator CbpM [Gammaproteobacteria bacterium]